MNSLYMIELELSMFGLMSFLRSQNLNRNEDEDFGYGVHAWLAAAFGNLAPKPFRLFHGSSHRAPRVIGYSPADKGALAAYASDFASPAVLSVCDVTKALHSKAMPYKWEQGRRLGFQVLACPVSRKDGCEKDIFLRATDRVPKEQALDRSRIYCDWLTDQLKRYATVENLKLEAYQMVHHIRRRHDRKPTTLTRPRADFSGVLQISDEREFAGILARGVGRHRSFGYGMLLLRPAL
jgi:CRISPR system Cascade subunit CasE